MKIKKHISLLTVLFFVLSFLPVCAEVGNSQHNPPVELTGALYVDNAETADSNDLKILDRVRVAEDMNIENDGFSYARDHHAATGDSDSERLRSLDGAGITYKNDCFDITGFIFYTYVTGINEKTDYNIYISYDGEEFLEFIPETKAGAAANGRIEKIYYSNSLPDGVRFVKIEFSRLEDSWTEHWRTQIGRAVVAFEDDGHILPVPIRMENNVYTDEANSAENTGIATYTNLTPSSPVCDFGGNHAAGCGCFAQRLDTDFLMRKTNAQSSIVYKSPSEDITDFVLWANRLNGLDEAVTVKVSSNGRSYKSFARTVIQRAPIHPDYLTKGYGNNWGEYRYTLENLPKGIRYIKVTVAAPAADFLWGTSIAKAVMAYNSPEKTKSINYKTYAAPSKAILSDVYSVYVRNPGACSWEKVDVYSARVCKNDVREGRADLQTRTSFAYFDFEKSVEVKVKYNPLQASNFRIRPEKNAVPIKSEGSTVLFTLDKPCNISIEHDGDIYNNLQLFTNPPETYVPDKESEDVLYFPPGYYTREDAVKLIKTYFTTALLGQVNVSSDKTLYISGGAVVDAYTAIGDEFDSGSGSILRGASNIKICGRGILNMQPWSTDDGSRADTACNNGIYFENAANVEISDIILLNPGQAGIAGRSSENVKINNVRLFSNMPWGDGINLYGVKNVEIKNCFLRTSDDSVSIYTNNNSTSDVTVEGCVLWADVAHGVNIGTHGSADAGNRSDISDIAVLNSDVLHCRSTKRDYNGALAVNLGDENTGSNIRFENINIEDCDESSAINARVMRNADYNKVPGKSLSNVTFKNINVKCDREKIAKSDIYGYADDRMISDVRIENFRINGVQATDAEDAMLDIGGYAKNISVVSDKKTVIYNAAENTPENGLINAKYRLYRNTFDSSDGIVTNGSVSDGELILDNGGFAVFNIKSVRQAAFLMHGDAEFCVSENGTDYVPFENVYTTVKENLGERVYLLSGIPKGISYIKAFVDSGTRLSALEADYVGDKYFSACFDTAGREVLYTAESDEKDGFFGILARYENGILKSAERIALKGDGKIKVGTGNYRFFIWDEDLVPCTGVLEIN